MIPPRVLHELVRSLAQRTGRSRATWHKPKYDRQEYRMRLSGARDIIYRESRRRKLVEVSVQDPSGEILGAVSAEENDKPYEHMADLVFAVQRSLDANIKTTTDDVLRLIKEEKETEAKKGVLNA